MSVEREQSDALSWSWRNGRFSFLSVQRLLLDLAKLLFLSQGILGWIEMRASATDISSIVCIFTSRYKTLHVESKLNWCQTRNQAF